MTARSVAPGNRSPTPVALVHDSNTYGGMEVVMLLLLRYLDRTRYQPHVMVPGYTDPDHASPQQFIDEVGKLGVPVLRPQHPGYTRGVSFLRDVWNIARLFRQARVQIVHIHTCQPARSRKATLAGRLAGAAVVRTEHLPPSGTTMSSRDRTLLRPFDALTSRIIVVSDANRKEQIEDLGRDPHKVYRSYNGIELDRFQISQDVASAKRQIGADPRRPLVGTVGRLDQQKGQTYLIDAAAKLVQDHPEVQIVLVGSGQLEQSLRAQASRLGLDNHIVFAGYQSNPRPYIEAMDVAVMPSLFEGFSLSMLEFMAMGKPLVVSDYPSMREGVVDGESGIVVRRKDSEGLARAISSLLSNPDMALRMGQAALRRAQKEFSIQRHVDDMMATYDLVLQRAPEIAPQPYPRRLS